jgi:hypothetical protein
VIFGEPILVSVIIYPLTRKSEFPSFGVRFPSFNWVMSPVIFFNEASVLKTLASLKNQTPKNRTPEKKKWTT